MLGFEYAVIDSATCAESFRKWKAIRCLDHVATIHGEWAQTPMHSGRSSIQLSCSTDRSVLRVQVFASVPSPIILVARMDDGFSILDALPYIPRIVNKETLYAWPELAWRSDLAHWLKLEHFPKPIKSIGVGRLKVDADDPNIAAAIQRRKENSLRKEANAEALASRQRVQELIDTLLKLSKSEFQIDSGLTNSLGTYSDSVVAEAVREVKTDVQSLIAQIEMHAERIKDQQHTHRGYGKPKEAALRLLAQRIKSMPPLSAFEST